MLGMRLRLLCISRRCISAKRWTGTWWNLYRIFIYNQAEIYMAKGNNSQKKEKKKPKKEAVKR